MRCRANRAIMVLAFRDNHEAAIPIPAGANFTVVGPAPDDRFIVVSIAGEEFLVFESDLRERATPLASAEPAAALACA